MTLKKYSFIALICILLLSLFYFNNVSALSCASPLPINESFQHYEGIIIGNVVEIEKEKEEKILTVKVQKSLKGINEEVLIIKEDMMWGESMENETYIFYLQKNKSNDWSNPLCSPTSSLTNDINEALTYSLENDFTVKEFTQEEVPVVMPSNDNKTTNENNQAENKELKEEVKEDVKEYKKKSLNKEVIILSFILLSLIISVIVYSRNKK